MNKEELIKKMFELREFLDLDDTTEGGEWGYDAFRAKLLRGEDFWRKGETFEEWLDTSIEQLELHIEQLFGWLFVLKKIRKILRGGR